MFGDKRIYLWIHVCEEKEFLHKLVVKLFGTAAKIILHDFVFVM